MTTTIKEVSSERRAVSESIATARRRLPWAWTGNGLMRLATGASGVLVGLYLAEVTNRRYGFGAGSVGALGAVYFVSELLNVRNVGHGRCCDCKVASS